jgi:hypothetical protein
MAIDSKHYFRIVFRGFIGGKIARLDRVERSLQCIIIKETNHRVLV